jgi:hypothetical protein
VNDVDDAGFERRADPAHRGEHTAFHALRQGDAVNIEVDLLARYVERLLDTIEIGVPSSLDRLGTNGLLQRGWLIAVRGEPVEP